MPRHRPGPPITAAARAATKRRDSRFHEQVRRLRRQLQASKGKQ